MNRRDRTKTVVCLIDMDCFYCQVEEKLNPKLKGQPVAVVQYNQFQGGGIIAVNYAARERGVTRHMRGDEAKKHCPEIKLARVPNVREKADLTRYRDAGTEVAAVLQKNTTLLERASVDEAYLDLTMRVEERLTLFDSGEFSLTLETLKNSFAVGFDDIEEILKDTTEDDDDEQSHDDDLEAEEAKQSNLRLLIGATIVNEIRAQVKEETGYECSAGIAHNKILAKLACGMNKPNKQTVLPQREIPKLFQTLPIGKIRGLGAKMGELVCDTLKVKFMGDLLAFSERDLQAKFDEKNGSWLYLMCRGIDLEPVTQKYTSKSIGCCKKFPGRGAIRTVGLLNHWLAELATEVHDRLEKDRQVNNRRAQLLTVSYMQALNGEDVSSSRSIPLEAYDQKRIATDAFECLKRNTEQFLCPGDEGNLNNAIKFLGLSVGKFEKISKDRNRIQEMFKQVQVKRQSMVEEAEKKKADKVEEKQLEIPVQKETKVTKEEKAPQLSFFQKYQLRMEEEREAKRKALEAAQSTTPLLDDLINEMEEQDESGEVEDEEDEQNETIDLSIIENSSSSEPIEPAQLTATLPTTSYKSEYAEFNAQQLNLDEFMKVCPECNKKVANYDYVSHQDRHFAMALSQQQRVDFRAAIQKKAGPSNSPKPSTSSVKRSQRTTSTATPSSSQIVKFLKKEPEDSHQEPLPGTELCPDCGKAIPLDQLLEHSDHHVAKKLQLELEREMRGIVSVITKTSSPAVPKKRKTPSSASQSKSIATYFSNDGA